MRTFMALVIVVLATATHSEPARGWLTGEEGDFLQFDCKSDEENIVECDFTQISMDLKQAPDEIPALVQEQLAKLTEQLKDEFSEDTCTIILALHQVVTSIIDGDQDTAKKVVAQLPEKAQGELNVESMVKGFSRMGPREIDDARTGMKLLAKACDQPTKDDLEAMLRFDLEKKARTCTLFVNNWSAKFKRASDHLWTLTDNQPQGTCSVVRLDRFECDDGPYSCDFISEKRVLDKNSTSVLRCDKLDEKAFRYVHDSDGIYVNCEIMSFF